jgi:uncharacterized protein YggE
MRFIGLIVATMLLAGAARADDALPGISVVGYGMVKARPSTVEINAVISGDAELGRDASVKQRDARQRIVDSLDKLKDLPVTLESRGFAVNQTVDPAMQALQQRAVQQLVVQGGVIIQSPTVVDVARKISVSEQVRLVLSDADKLDMPKLKETVVRLVDAARDSGLQFGLPSAAQSSALAVIQSQSAAPLITYRIADTTAVREEAYKAALEDARKKASRLAELSGIKIGRIISIREEDSRTNPSQPDAGLSSNVLGELTMNVGLTVQFEITR